MWKGKSKESFLSFAFAFSLLFDGRKIAGSQCGIIGMH
jgi:hypothetical protein